MTLAQNSRGKYVKYQIPILQIAKRVRKTKAEQNYFLLYDIPIHNSLHPLLNIQITEKIGQEIICLKGIQVQVQVRCGAIILYDLIYVYILMHTQ